MAMQVSHPGTNVLIVCMCTSCPIYIFVNVAILCSWLYGNRYCMHAYTCYLINKNTCNDSHSVVFVLVAYLLALY